MKVKKKDSVLMIWRGLALPKCHDPNEREAENDCRWIGGGTSVVTYLQRNLTCKEMIFQIKSLRHPLPIPNLWKVQWGARLTAHLLTNKQKTKFTFRSFDLACESLQTRQMRLATIQSIFCFLNRLHRAYFVTHVATSGSDWFDLWNCLTTHLMIWIRMDTSELLKQDIGIDYQTFTTFRQVYPSHL